MEEIHRHWLRPVDLRDVAEEEEKKGFAMVPQSVGDPCGHCGFILVDFIPSV